jgi:hypothetical protein
MAWYDDILGTGSNIFGARPADYLVGKEGLLNQTEQQKLSQRALTSGLLGTAITYLAQPKNQRYGSALPYLGKAFLTGMGQSQGVYDQATQDWLTKQKVSDIQKATAKEANLKSLLSGLSLDPNKPISRETIQGLYKTGDPASIDIANKILDAEKTMKEVYAVPKAGYKILTDNDVKLLNAESSKIKFNPLATWQQNVDTGQITAIPETMPSTKDTYRTLTNDEAKKEGLDTSRGQKYQVNSSNNINLIGGQIAPEDKVKTPRSVSKEDKENVKIVLENNGITKDNDILTTAVAARTNKLMQDEGLDQTSAIQKAIQELKGAGTLKTYQRNIDIPFIGKTKIPFSESTAFNINKSDVPNTPKKPISEDEYNKLPVGASYVAPNGQTLTKK